VSEPRVTRNDDEHRYELWVGDALAGFAQFRELPHQVLFTHTEVDDAYAGQGLGSVLVRAAVEDVVGRGKTIVPYCPFVAAYLRRHREHADHVEWPDGDAADPEILAP